MGCRPTTRHSIFSATPGGRVPLHCAHVVADDRVNLYENKSTTHRASITSKRRVPLLSHHFRHVFVRADVAIVTTEGDVAVAGVASSQAEKDLVTKLATDIVSVKSVTHTMTTK